MSTNKTPKGGRSSPVKQRTLKNNNDVNNSNLNASQQQDTEYVLLDKQLINGLTEKDVEIDHLKTTVVALQEKVVVIDDMKLDVQHHKELTAHSEVKRHELQVHITETSVTIHKDTEVHNNYQSELIVENDGLKREIQSLKEHQARRERDHLQTLEDTHRAHKAQVDRMSDEHSHKVQTLTKEHHDKLETQEKENHEKLTQVNHDCQQKIAQLNDEHSRKINALTDDYNRKVSNLTDECNRKVNNLTDEYNHKTQQMSDDHHRKMEEAKNEFHKKLDEAERDHKQKMDELRNELEQQRITKDARIRTLESDLETQRATFERRIDSLEQTIKRQQQTILTLQSTIIELKEVITQKLDVEDQLEKTRQLLANIDAQKDQLLKELETASDYILELEEKVYKANKTSLELLRQLKDAEVEIETLKNYIIELKQRIAVYIPVKDDVIDRRLAEFINNYPERQKLKIMFMRESEGVYQFGTKRVAVRVDKDKINIRVGGGYLSIDEFLDQYTPGELDKLERKDPLKKFSEKIAIQKTIVGKEIRESSPIRSPDRASSPKRMQ